MSNAWKRRTLLQAGVLSAVSPLSAFAQQWPERPVRMLVGVAPGNSTDAAARQLAMRMGAILGQSVFVENKPGGHGAIVAEAVKSAAKDGYTLLYSSGGQLAINPSLYPNLKYNPRKDFEPVALVSRGYLYLAVKGDAPINNVKELVAYVKERAGKVNYGSGGNGTTQHLAMEVLKKKTGMAITHVPYRGTPMALQDLMGDQILCMFDAGASILPQARQGKVKIIAVTSPARDAHLPEVATLREQGIDTREIAVWSGLLVPAGVPKAVIARLSDAVATAVKQPDYIENVRLTGGSLVGSTPEAFKTYLDQEIAMWSPIVKESGAQVD